MSACNDIQPTLFRLAEGEASPDEAIAAAHHLSACTVCRIRMARERRLGELIERDLVDLPVDQDFVDQVMARLPQEVPKAKDSLVKRKRGLKLAAWAGLLALTGAGAGAGGHGTGSVADGLTSGWGGLGDGRGWESLTQSLIQGSIATIQAMGTSGLAFLPTRSFVVDLAVQGALLSGAILAALVVASTMLTFMARHNTSRI